MLHKFHKEKGFLR